MPAIKIIHDMILSIFLKLVRNSAKTFNPIKMKISIHNSIMVVGIKVYHRNSIVIN